MGKTMDKKTILLEAKERIMEQGVIRHLYASHNCYCAVGHIACAYGNGLINRLSLYNDASVYMVETALKPLIEAGFTISELHALQNCNDDWDDEEERRFKVLKYIDILIAEI